MSLRQCDCQCELSRLVSAVWRGHYYFPGDVVSVAGKSSDFTVDMLVFSPNILREASLDIEHSIYEKLREDRCRTDSQVVSDIVKSMFMLLGLYFRQSTCKCLDKLVLYQLKAFFIGFHDYISRFPDMVQPSSSSRRKRDLFNSFMKLIEMNFRRYRDVNWYAGQLNISSKYLNVITKGITGHSAKTLVDHYVVLKLKQELSGTDKSLKQLAWDYNFVMPLFYKIFPPAYGSDATCLATAGRKSGIDCFSVAGGKTPSGHKDNNKGSPVSGTAQMGLVYGKTI